MTPGSRWTPMATTRPAVVAGLLMVLGAPAHDVRLRDAEPASRWGARGHEMATRLAVESLPPEMPAFFTAAGDELVFLAPEPDRWRVRSSVEMDRAWSYDHYIDFENVPDRALEARDRFGYLNALRDAGLDAPEEEAGLLPFRIVELQQRLTSLWTRWHDTRDPERRRWIEALIVRDAGVLGHYVTDGSQPHHTTIHFNGWAGGADNPEGFTRDRRFHSRFESDYVNAHVGIDDIRARVSPVGAALEEPRSAVMAYLRETHETVRTLYRLDRDRGFDSGGAPDAAVHAFTVERLAAGTRMLATLWWTAYVDGRDGGAERSVPGTPTFPHAMLRPRGVGEPGMEEGMMEGADGSATSGVFGGLDAKLTVFALANGVDLAKGDGYRRLEWFTEGLERGILLEPCSDAACHVVVMAWRTGKADRRNDRIFASDVAFDQVPRMLDDAIEAANELDDPGAPD